MELNIAKFLEASTASEAAKILDSASHTAVTFQHFEELGRLYAYVKQYESALIYFEKALALTRDPESFYSCHANLAKYYNILNDPEKALLHLKLNEDLRPGSPDCLLEQVFSLFKLNRKNEAESILLSLAQRTDLSDFMYTMVDFNLGIFDLMRGRFQKGMRRFILMGKDFSVVNKREFPLPKWSGGNTDGKKLLIAAESGIGDEIIAFRFCQHLRDAGIEPIWLTNDRSDLASIFTRCGTRAYSTYDDVVRAEGQNLVWCNAMTLPIFLNCSGSDLWKGPYLTSHHDYVEKYSELFKPFKQKVKIGLRWSGNPAYDDDLKRRLPIDKLVEICANENTALFSLQRDDPNPEIPEPLLDLAPHLITWDDTLALLSNLDLVITSCTSVAHAAAALGKRTVVFVPIVEYYTWASTQDTTTIWYGENVTVLRQTDCRNWDAPMKQLADKLNTIL